MLSKSQIIKNFFSKRGAFIINGLINLSLIPFVLKHLGDAGFGVWVLTNVFTGYLGLLDLGIRSSVIRYVSKYRAVGDYHSLNQTVSTSLAAFSAIGAFTLILTVILSFLFNSIFKIPTEFQSQASWVVILVGLNLAFSLPAGVFTGILRGRAQAEQNTLLV